MGEAESDATDLDDPPGAEPRVELRAVVVAGDAVDGREGLQQVDREWVGPVAGVEDPLDAALPDPRDERGRERAPEPGQVGVRDEGDPHAPRLPAAHAAGAGATIGRVTVRPR